MSSKCPLCGKSKTDKSLFCPVCTVKLDSEYELNIPKSDDSPFSPIEQEKMTSEQFIEEEQESPQNDLDQIHDTSQQNIEEEPEVVFPAQAFDKKAWSKQQPDSRIDSDKSYYEIARDKKTNKVRFTIISLFILTILVVASLFIYNDYVKGGNLERAKWEVAQRENTVDGYLTYMDEYPQGSFAKEAYSKMISLKGNETEAWQNLMTSENTVEFNDFLTLYPKSPYERKVRIRLDSLMWESSLKENSAQSYSEYLNMSTTGKISGNYIGDAQNRFEMLKQSTPIDEVDLQQIKETVNGFFIGLSNISHSELNDYLAPVILRFNKSNNIPKERMIGELVLSAAKADAKSLRFDPEITNLKYERMGNETFLVNVPVQKIFDGNNGQINQIKGYIIHLKLNSNYMIYSFHETKPYPTAP